MTTIFKRFRKEMWYLPRIHIFYAVSFVILSAGLYFFQSPVPQEWFYFLPLLLLISSVRVEIVLLGFLGAAGLTLSLYGLELSYFAAMTVALIVTFPITALLHIASHGSIRPQWLGRCIGEAMGIMQLSCFADWTVVHVLHHAHSDDPEKDPHPPAGLSYVTFLLGMRKSIGRVLLNNFSSQFSHHENFMRPLKVLMIASKVRQFSWVAFWFLLLGPKLFTFGLAFSIVVKMLNYAWFNWSTHRLNESGEVEIFNLDHGLYKVINRYAFNLYYHNNHHQRMSIANPKRVDSEDVPEAIAS